MSCINRNLSAEQDLLSNIKTYLPDLTPVTLNDLKNPSSTFICNFFTSYLTELGVNATNLLMIQSNQLPLVTHVEMYSATIPYINLYAAINYFLVNIGVNDFCLSDLVNPVARRTMIHLSSLMHFLIHCDETIGALNPDLEMIGAMKKKCEELQSKIETLRVEINRKEIERVVRKEDIEELQKLVEKEKQELDELFVKKEIHKKEVDAIKKLIIMDEENETQLIRMIKNLEDDIEKLEAMIVVSPQKLIDNLEQLVIKRDEAVETLKSLKSQIEEKKRLTSLLNNETDEQKNREEKLNELIEVENVIKALNHKYDTYCQKLVKFAENDKEIQQQITYVKQKLDQLQNTEIELKQRKTKQAAEKREEIKAEEKKYNDILSAYEETKAYLNQRQVQFNSLKNQLKVLNQEAKKEYDEYVNFLKDINEKEEELKSTYKNILVRLQEINKNLSF